MVLPDGFVPLRNVLSSGDQSSFLGAIEKIQAPVQPEPGGDYVIHFTIRDKFPGDEKDSVPCIIKGWKAEWLPKGDPGDVAILRGMKVEILGTNNTKTLVNDSGIQSQALFFPAKSIPAPEIGHDYHSGGTSKLIYKSMINSRPPSSVEQMAVINMKAAAAPLLEQLKDPKVMFQARLGSTNSTTPKRGGKRQSLISNMTYNMFYDLVGEVVKTFWGVYTVDLYVTDYTTNTDLFLYEEKSDTEYVGAHQKPWPGPFGQMTIQIRCYEPHAGYARELKEGDFVFLQNIHTKLSQSNKLEGAIHQDPRYPMKVGIRKCTHPAQLGGLKERKAEYEKKHAGTLLSREVPTNVPKEPSAVVLSTKKQNKKEKKQKEKQKEQEEVKRKAEEIGKAVKDLNPNVCAGHEDVGLSTVDEIVNNPHLKTITETGDELTLPFVNSRYRTRLRVVDHWPLQLKNFTRSTSIPTTSQASALTSSTGNSQSLKDASQSGNFAWHFFLLVEDANAPEGSTPTRFPLTIDTARAQCLLKMDPCDLSARPKTLYELEHKLSVLWGNLHERKAALKKEGINLPLPVGDNKLALSNKPFECCVEEYGVPVDPEGKPYTEDVIKAMVNAMDDPSTDEGAHALKVLGNPKTWKRTWSPYNTTIKSGLEDW
ncbi:hypothetical protein BU23DRAFT_600549 [Bimuria novae-zelandiae CBS 107.79]|uniref:Protection of telomeres protein 1 ssDNA-binding domain-containing protein n=1 Tax=Bimuria novae-zelandiae CBS 107.79 TaxID=1447943 RepID=A0A6A5V4K7_9PLEO|nr:hypothetical protein BU23DRAFT_600549 [Bimuria novae-zelandiae CBS 107.79]